MINPDTPLKLWLYKNFDAARTVAWFAWGKPYFSYRVGHFIIHKTIWSKYYD